MILINKVTSRSKDLLDTNLSWTNNVLMLSFAYVNKHSSTEKLYRCRRLHEEGMRDPQQQHRCVDAEINCQRTSYSAKLRGGTLSSPQAFRQQGCPCTPLHCHHVILQHLNAAIECIHTLSYSITTLLSNAILQHHNSTTAQPYSLEFSYPKSNPCN